MGKVVMRKEVQEEQQRIITKKNNNKKKQQEETTRRIRTRLVTRLDGVFACKFDTLLGSMSLYMTRPFKKKKTFKTGGILGRLKN